MTGRDLNMELGYTGMERGVRELALKEKLATVEEIATMPQLDVCELIAEHYEMVFAENEKVGLVKKKKIKKSYLKC